MSKTMKAGALALLLGGCATTPRPLPMAATGSPLFATALPPLDPPQRFRVPVGDAPARGPADAPVTVVLLSSFECGACNTANLQLETLVQKYGPRLRVVWRPLSGSGHADDQLQVQTALAAGAQGKAWEMIHALSVAPQHDAATTAAQVRALGLDAAALATEPAAERIQQEDRALWHALQLKHTPWFFVNGRSLPGPASDAQLAALVDEELAAPVVPYAQRMADAEISTQAEPFAAPLTAAECPQPTAASPVFSYEGVTLTNVCEGLYVDPAMPPARVTRVGRAWVSARQRLALAFGPLASQPLSLICDSDVCRKAWGGDIKTSVSVGPNRKLPGPAGRVMPQAQVFMRETSYPFVSFFAHELTHAETFTRAPDAIPSWFSEGLATSIAGAPPCKPGDTGALHSMKGHTSPEQWAALSNDLATRHFAYCLAAAEVEAWVRKYGREHFLGMFPADMTFNAYYGPLVLP